MNPEPPQTDVEYKTIPEPPTTSLNPVSGQNENPLPAPETSAPPPASLRETIYYWLMARP